VSEWRWEGSEKRQRDDVALEGGKGCVGQGVKNGGWIIQSGGSEWGEGSQTGGIARPL